jgi:hypothetical protein
VDDHGDGHHGRQHEAHGQEEDGADLGTELALRGVEGRVVDQRWQEDQQHQFRLERDTVLGGDEGHPDAGDDQQDGVGDPQPVGDGGDDHDADEEPDPIRDADHRSDAGRRWRRAGTACTRDNLLSA